MSDPLARLVVDEHEVNRELLASVLAPLMTLDPTRGSFAFRIGVRDGLQHSEVILAALLARKALVLLDADVVEPVQPKELEDLTGIKGGSLRPALRRLSHEGVVRKVEGGYTVPSHSLADIANLLPSER